MMYRLDVRVLGDGSSSAIRGARALVVVLGCASASCNGFLGLSELSFEDDDEDTGGRAFGGAAGSRTGGTSGTLGGGGATIGTGGNGSSEPNCRWRSGPTPVNIEGRFCMDSTEVTNADYADFLASAPPPPTNPLCAWNFDYTPSGTWPAAVEEQRLPVTYVDYCDAKGYCEWAGKRLCGAIGGGPSNYDNWPLNTEFYYACSGGGALVYPYGNSYNAAACHTDGKFNARAVGSSLDCEGGFAGLFDLSGNVAEWQDACTDLGFGADLDQCLMGSNGFSRYDTGNPPGSDFSCGVRVSMFRDFDFDDHGIRCCSDAIP